jgi:hypothetical protein
MAEMSKPGWFVRLVKRAIWADCLYFLHQLLLSVTFLDSPNISVYAILLCLRLSVFLIAPPTVLLPNLGCCCSIKNCLNPSSRFCSVCLNGHLVVFK